MREKIIIVCIVVFLSSCSNIQQLTKYQFNYTYGSIGIGPEPVTDFIFMKKNQENMMVSDAIKRAFLKNELSIINNDINDLDYNKKYSTEYKVLTDEDIENYNFKISSESLYSLKKGPKYRIRYEAKYRIREETMTLIISISAILEIQGKYSSKWHKISNYKGSYFTNEINNSLKEILIAN